MSGSANITASNLPGYWSRPYDTLPVPPAPAAPTVEALPFITAVDTVPDSALSADGGSWDQTVNLSWQWQHNLGAGMVNVGSPITGAGPAPYALLLGEVGHFVRVMVTATNPVTGLSTTVASSNTITVTPTIPPAVAPIDLYRYNTGSFRLFDLATNVDVFCAALAATGTQAVRLDIEFGTIMSGSGATPNGFAMYDSWTLALAKRGIRVWPLFLHAPIWGRKYPLDANGGSRFSLWDDGTQMMGPTGAQNGGHGLQNANMLAYPGIIINAALDRWGQGGTFWAAHPEVAALPWLMGELENEWNGANGSNSGKLDTVSSNTWQTHGVVTWGEYMRYYSRVQGDVHTAHPEFTLCFGALTGGPSTIGYAPSGENATQGITFTGCNAYALANGMSALRIPFVVNHAYAQAWGTPASATTSIGRYLNAGAVAIAASTIFQDDSGNPAQQMVNETGWSTAPGGSLSQTDASAAALITQGVAFMNSYQAQLGMCGIGLYNSITPEDNPQTQEGWFGWQHHDGGGTLRRAAWTSLIASDPLGAP